MGLTKYPIRWFLLLKGIICPRYILLKVVAFGKEMDGVGNEKGQPWATCWGTRVANKMEAHTWVSSI